MDNTIELELKAVDFKGARFVSDYCGLSNAIRRQLNIDKVNTGVYDVEIEGIDYDIDEGYQYEKHSDDIKSATSLSFDNTIIRTITLTKAQ